MTRSDLLKVPVLLLGYSLLAQLEILANRAIDLKYNDSERWLIELEKLDEDQAKKIKGRRKKAAKENLSLPTIELADLVGKLKVIQDFLPKVTDFEVELKELVEFRNAVDHVRPLVPSNDHLDRFVRRLEIVGRPLLAESSNARIASRTAKCRRLSAKLGVETNPMITLCEGAIQPTILLCRILRACVIRDNQRYGVSQMCLKDRVADSNFKIVAVGLGMAIQLTYPPGIIRMCRLYYDEVTRSDWVERKAAKGLHIVSARKPMCRVGTIQD